MKHHKHHQHYEITAKKISRISQIALDVTLAIAIGVALAATLVYGWPL